MAQEPQRKVQVWDLPTRAFHWVLVLLIIGSVTTVKLGGDWMTWHERFGIAILILIAFRIVWGFVGGEHARFASFVRGPMTVLRYAKTALSSKDPQLGHNPMGAYSVLALLASVTTQAVTGLFTDDEIATTGPLANQVSSATSALMTRIHHLNENVLFALIGLHVAAILFYLLKKKENLVRPMITGEKPWEGPVPTTTRPANGSGVLALVVLVVVAFGVYYLTRRVPLGG